MGFLLAMSTMSNLVMEYARMGIKCKVAGLGSFYVLLSLLSYLSSLLSSLFSPLPFPLRYSFLLFV